jgi:hypothetical protein
MIEVTLLATRKYHSEYVRQKFGIVKFWVRLRLLG